jgi:hypothetical protein
MIPPPWPGVPSSVAIVPWAKRVDEVLRAQCTGCAQRFDCTEYSTHLGSKPSKVKRDVSLYVVSKN